MPKFLRTAVTGFAMLATFVALAVYAAGMGFKPGLWDVRVVKMVVDGRDVSGQMAAMAALGQKAMASLPADQRARMEATLKQSGVGQDGNGGFQICVSPAMAKRDAPLIDKEGHCQPTTVTHNGNQTSYEFSCTRNGGTTTGKGISTTAGDLITTRVDMSTTAANGKARVMHNESEMHYLGPDCGDVKPADASGPAAAPAAAPAPTPK